jgi:hypothetical protein
MDVEYEVASLSEKENPLGDGSLSSDTDVSVLISGEAWKIVTSRLSE